VAERYASRDEGVHGTANGPIPDALSGLDTDLAGSDTDDQPVTVGGDVRRPSARTRPLAAVRRLYQGSLAQRFFRRLDDLDFANQIMLLGSGLLISLLPFLILLSAFASERVDDDLSLRLGLDHRAAAIVTTLFKSAPASFNGSTISSLVFMLAGAMTVAARSSRYTRRRSGKVIRGACGIGPGCSCGPRC
jgi:hypothetical protein